MRRTLAVLGTRAFQRLANSQATNPHRTELPVKRTTTTTAATANERIFQGSEADTRKAKAKALRVEDTFGSFMYLAAFSFGWRCAWWLQCLT